MADPHPRLESVLSDNAGSWLDLGTVPPLDTAPANSTEFAVEADAAFVIRDTAQDLAALLRAVAVVAEMSAEAVIHDACERLAGRLRSALRTVVDLSPDAGDGAVLAELVAAPESVPPESRAGDALRGLMQLIEHVDDVIARVRRRLQLQDHESGIEEALLNLASDLARARHGLGALAAARLFSNARPSATGGFPWI